MNLFKECFFIYFFITHVQRWCLQQSSVCALKGISIFPIVVCDKGTFGLECKTLCAHCRDTDECNPVNGSCPNGCEKGATGFDCNSGT